MKRFQRLVPILAVLWTATEMTASADTRMRTTSASAILTQPAGNAPQVGRLQTGAVLSVLRTEGDWAVIAPPDQLELWVNKDFIEGNKVVAKTIQIRSGPGIQHPVAGTLARNDVITPRGEEGDWCRIAAPASLTLWVPKKDLAEASVPPPPAPAAAIPPPAPPPPAPAPAPAPAPQSAPAVSPAPAAKPAPAPAPRPVVQPSVPAPESPRAAAPPAAAAPPPSRPAPAVKSTPPPKPIQPAPAAPMAAAPAKPPLRPATAIPGPTPAPALKPAPPPGVPAPASAVAAQKSKDLEVTVDQALVDQLDLADVPNQGKSVQVEGELRNTPFMAASPSRFRLQSRNADNVLEMICHVHGDARQLRPYIGKAVSLRGREYWVEESDMPVVVVGQIVPLSSTSEPVMF